MIHFLFTHLIHPMHSLPRAEQKHADFFFLLLRLLLLQTLLYVFLHALSISHKTELPVFHGLHFQHQSNRFPESGHALYTKVHVLTNILNQFLIITHIFDNFIHLSFFNFCPGCNCRSFRTITNSINHFHHIIIFQ